MGDQPENAQLIKDRGIGEILIDLKHCKASGDGDKSPEFTTPIFTAQKVTDIFTKVLNDEKY